MKLKFLIPLFSLLLISIFGRVKADASAPTPGWNTTASNKPSELNLVTADFTQMVSVFEEDDILIVNIYHNDGTFDQVDLDSIIAFDENHLTIYAGRIAICVMNYGDDWYLKLPGSSCYQSAFLYKPVGYFKTFDQECGCLQLWPYDNWLDEDENTVALSTVFGIKTVNKPPTRSRE